MNTQNRINVLKNEISSDRVNLEILKGIEYDASFFTKVSKPEMVSDLERMIRENEELLLDLVA